MEKLDKINIFASLAIAGFFGLAAYLAEAYQHALYHNLTVPVPIIFSILAASLFLIKFVLAIKKLSKMSEIKAPIQTRGYKGKIWLTIIHVILSLEQNAISSYALVMFMLAFTFGIDTPQLRYAMQIDHMGTLVAFPLLDVFYTIYPNIANRIDIYLKKKKSKKLLING